MRPHVPRRLAWSRGYWPLGAVRSSVEPDELSRWHNDKVLFLLLLILILLLLSFRETYGLV